MHVTVGICTKDRGDSIARTVQSLLASSYVDFDVLVVDQSESDETAQAVTRAASGDPRVSYIRSATSGSSVAHNVAVARARGEIIAFTDDDCEVSECWLDVLVSYFRRHDDVGLVCGAVRPGPHDATRGSIPDLIIPRTRRIGSPWLKWRDRGIGANMAFRREALLAIGPYDEVLGPGAPLYACLDRDMTYRVLKAGYAVLNVPDAWVTHHGFRAWGDWRLIVRRAGIGVGAANMKQLRLGDAAMLPTFVVEWLRCIQWSRLLTLRRGNGLALFGAYAQGAAMSFRFAVDPTTRTYVLPARQPDRRPV